MSKAPRNKEYNFLHCYCVRKRKTEVRPMFASSSALSYPYKTFHWQLCMLKLRKLERCPNIEHLLPVQPKINILSIYRKN
jgi:hypothetical protein